MDPSSLHRVTADSGMVYELAGSLSTLGGTRGDPGTAGLLLAAGSPRRGAGEGHVGRGVFATGELSGVLK